MKVGMRNNPGVIEDQVYPEHGPEYGWSKRGMRDGMKIFFTTADWEPIPTEQWRDCTGECYMGGLHGREICHDVPGDTNYPLNHADYHLRKIELQVPPPLGAGHIFSAYRTVFIVERKESHD